MAVYSEKWAHLDPRMRTGPSRSFCWTWPGKPTYKWRFKWEHHRTRRWVFQHATFDYRMHPDATNIIWWGYHRSWFCLLSRSNLIYKIFRGKNINLGTSSYPFSIGIFPCKPSSELGVLPFVGKKHEHWDQILGSSQVLGLNRRPKTRAWTENIQISIQDESHCLQSEHVPWWGRRFFPTVALNLLVFNALA